MGSRPQRDSGPAEAGVGRLFAERERQLEAALDGMGDGRPEARRLITRELAFEPRPAQLRSLASLTGVRGRALAVARRFVAVYLVGDAELRGFHQTAELDPAALAASAERMPALLQAGDAVERELLERLADDAQPLADATRDTLLRIAEAFAPPKGALAAAALIAPRLAALAVAARAGDPRAALPLLTEPEAEAIRRAATGTRDAFGDAPVRACIDAGALRTLIEEALADWERLGCPRNDDEIRRAYRDRLVERLGALKAACSVVSARLQRKQDEALVAGLERYAEELRAAGRGLFAATLRLAPILRDPYATSGEGATRLAPRRA